MGGADELFLRADPGVEVKPVPEPLHQRVGTAGSSMDSYGAKGQTGEDLEVWLPRIPGCHAEVLEARGRARSHAKETKSLPERNAFPGPRSTGTCRTFCRESPEKLSG